MEPLTKQDREAILFNLRNPLRGLEPATLEIVRRYEATLDALAAAPELCNLVFATTAVGPRLCIRPKGHNDGHTDQSWLARDLAIQREPKPSPDSIAAVPIQRLTEYEAVQAAAVFHDLNRHEDPYALVRTIEHVLKMRAQVAQPPARPTEPSAAAIEAACTQWLEYRLQGKPILVRPVVENILRAAYAVDFGAPPPPPETP